MNFLEKSGTVLLILMAVGLSGFKTYHSYAEATQNVPAEGGEYTEAIVGEVKYLNPLIAQNDAEKSISKLLFSGLVQIGDKNTIMADLAESWEISEDGKTYTFRLRKDSMFADGGKLTATDIAYTVSSIQTPELRSPLEKGFQNVEVEVLDDYTVVFTLPNAYGPFIYNCNFPVIPAHLTNAEFTKKITGSGPYMYVKSISSNDKLTELRLKKNPSYYGKKPLISDLKLKLYNSKDDAKAAFESDDKTAALFGATSSLGRNLSFESSRQLALIFNLRDDKLKDKSIREQIISGQRIENAKFTMTTQDLPAQHEKAEFIKNQWRSNGMDLAVNYLTPVKYQEAVSAKNYELLLFGFDSGYDRDPYPYWHSSQMSAMNLSGWSDKNSDILLEDARMLSDATERNEKYDQFFATVKSESLAVYFDPIDYNFSIKELVKNVQPVIGDKAYSRYNSIADWYIAEKRVKK